MTEDSKVFFEDVKSCYERESHNISWQWEDLESNENGEFILFYLAFNLSKNVIHGPLPDYLHNKMVLEVWVDEDDKNAVTLYVRDFAGNEKSGTI